MTVYGRDASNFDGSVDFAGLGFFTHKATEGISVVHDKYGARLTAARDFGVPVLGAYHVLRSPSAADGSYADQLRFWIGYLDAHTPWWRAHPHFMLQIDAERWPYDNVTPAEVLAFTGLVAGSGLPGWKVTYASRGQYGDSLRGIATALWNADYRRGPAYPGDGWVSSGGTPAGWADYSGQEPALLQYTSTPYDHNAFRGTLDQLLTLVGGTKGTVMAAEQDNQLLNVYSGMFFGGPSCGPVVPDPLPSTDQRAKGNSLFDLLQHIRTKVDGFATGGVDVDALAGKVTAALVTSNANGLTAADHDAVKADIVAVLNTVHLATG